MKSAHLTALAFAALMSFGAAIPVEKRNLFCYNYPTTIAGDYLAKRDQSIPDDAPVTNLAVREAGDLAPRDIPPPTHVPWCSIGTTIWVMCVSLARSFTNPYQLEVIHELVTDALIATDAYMHEHGEGMLLPGGTWNFVSPLNNRYTIHVHGVTTYLVLNGALESILNYMQHWDYFATGIWNIWDHHSDVAQLTIRYNNNF